MVGQLTSSGDPEWFDSHTYQLLAGGSCGDGNIELRDGATLVTVSSALDHEATSTCTGTLIQHRRCT